MKKLLCLTIVLALVAPAMAWTPYANQTLVFASMGSGIRAGGGNHAPKGEWGTYSREGYEYTLLRFDDLTGTDSATTGITYSASDIVSAELWLTAGYIETMGAGGQWGATPDSNGYAKLFEVTTPWEANNVNEAYSKQDTTTPWGGGGSFNANPTTSPDLDLIGDFVVPNPRVGIGGPLPVQSSPGEVSNPATINNRYHAKIDVTDLFKGWIGGTTDNNGMGITVSSWYADGDPNNVRQGSLQVNWFAGTSQYANHDPNGWIKYWEDPGYYFWWGPPVISVYVPEPATMSLLAIGGVVALLRRKR